MRLHLAPPSAKVLAPPPQETSEPSVVETVDADSQETVISLELSRAHAQLRRLRNDSQLLRHAVITSIPPDQSNVSAGLGGGTPDTRAASVRWRPRERTKPLLFLGVWFVHTTLSQSSAIRRSTRPDTDRLI